MPFEFIVIDEALSRLIVSLTVNLALFVPSPNTKSAPLIVSVAFVSKSSFVFQLNVPPVIVDVPTKNFEPLLTVIEPSVCVKLPL